MHSQIPMIHSDLDGTGNSVYARYIEGKSRRRWNRLRKRRHGFELHERRNCDVHNEGIRANLYLDIFECMGNLENVTG